MLVCVQMCLQVSVCVRQGLQVSGVTAVRLDTETSLSVFAVSVACLAASTRTPAAPASAR